MNFRLLLVLVALSCSQARPHHEPPADSSSSSSGQAGSTITNKDEAGAHGISKLSQQQAGTGGKVTGGGINVGTASTNTQSQTGLQGSSSSSNTDAQSQQGSSPTFGLPTFSGLPHGIPSPGFGSSIPSISIPDFGVPVIPSFPQGTASGQSGSTITKQETAGAHGTSHLSQQQAGTGGQVSGGGINVGSAGTNTQSQTSEQGSSSSSNTNAQSQQGSSPTFGVPVFSGLPHGLQSPGLGVPTPGFGIPEFAVPVIPSFPQGTASGQSGSTITKKEEAGAHGVSHLSQQQAGTGGKVTGSGINVGSAGTNTQSQNGVHGSSSSSNTDAQSEQKSGPSFNIHGFGSSGPSFSVPSFEVPVIPSFPLSSASGQSGGTITKQETAGIHGISKLSQQQASTGGKAAAGGINVGTANTNSQTQTGLQGSSTSSNTDAQSQQSASPTFVIPDFSGLGAGLKTPGFGVPVIPSFPQGTASGQSGSTITKQETAGAHGTSHLSQQQASTGGTASGGGVNIGSAGTNAQSQTGLQGSSSSSNTDAQSQQGSVAGFGGPLSVVLPPIPVIHGSASGQANSALTQSQTAGPDGTSSSVSQLGSHAGGSSQDGGVNVSSAHGSSSSSGGALGSSQQSQLGAQSTQTGR